MRPNLIQAPTLTLTLALTAGCGPQRGNQTIVTSLNTCDCGEWQTMDEEHFIPCAKGHLLIPAAPMLPLATTEL